MRTLTFHLLRTLVLAALLPAAQAAKPQSSGFGAGIILGEPTGISAKGWISADRAIDGGLAWSLAGAGYFSIHADYLFHNMNLIKVGKGRLPLYYGPGARIRTWNGNGYEHHGQWHGEGGAGLGIRFPVGLDYLPEKAPVDVFLEVVPGLDLLPSTWFDIGGALGVRYWF